MTHELKKGDIVVNYWVEGRWRITGFSDRFPHRTTIYVAAIDAAARNHLSRENQVGDGYTFNRDNCDLDAVCSFREEVSAGRSARVALQASAARGMDKIT